MEGMDRQQATNGAVKSILNNTYTILIARLVLGALFIVASFDKIADPLAFAASITNYKLTSSFVALASATVLPWIELICGVLLLLGFLRNGAGLVLMCLMAVFTVAVISALARGLDISCGCFTQDPTAARIGWWKVGENIGLLLLSAIVTFSKNPALSVEQMFGRFRSVS